MDAFRAYDRGEAEDIYKQSYGAAFGVNPKDVDADQRQLGKVNELSMGYAGGVGAFVNMANVYRVDLNDIVDPVMGAAAPDILARAERSLEWAQSHNKVGELSEDVYIACSVLKHAWRDAHPGIVRFWREIEVATQEAMDNPGKTFEASRLRFTYGKMKFGSALTMKLPSGRSIFYQSPKWKKPEENEDDFGGLRLTFMGMNQTTRKWTRLYTYSGSMSENATQAVARDVMLQTFPLIEASGYPIVLSVHDEVLTEVPDSPEYSAEELSSMLVKNAPWASGLPLKAEGWEGYFYRK